MPVRPDFDSMPELVPLSDAARYLDTSYGSLVGRVLRPGLPCRKPCGIVAVRLGGGPERSHWAIERCDLEVLWDVWFGQLGNAPGW